MLKKKKKFNLRNSMSEIHGDISRRSQKGAMIV